HLRERLESVQRRATRTIWSRSSGAADVSYNARLGALEWRPLGQRRRTSRVRAVCRLLDGSLAGSHLASVVRVSKRTGQPEPLRGRTTRHSESFIPAAIRDFLTIPLNTRNPLPASNDESRELCRLFSHQVASDTS
ncbi:uncharacterized protein ISCGN_006030, partial [Ixodes scapularis]